MTIANTPNQDEASRARERVMQAYDLPTSNEIVNSKKVLLLDLSACSSGEIVQPGGRMAVMEPMGLCSIQPICKQRGYQTKIIQQLDKSDEEILSEVRKYKPDIIMFTSFTSNYNNTVKVARSIKEDYAKNNNEITSIIGGYHVSGSLLRGDEITPLTNDMKAGIFDFVVRGEGEKTINELLEFLEDRSKGLSDKSLDSIAGLAYLDKESGVIKTIGKRPRMSDQELEELYTDEYVRAMREGLDMSRMDTGEGFGMPAHSKQHFATIYNQRGCNKNCSFCQTPEVWSRCGTSRSTESIINEMEHLHKDYDVNSVMFIDESFVGAGKPKARRLLKGIIEKELNEKMKFQCFLRADEIVDKQGNVDWELLQQLKDAGCYLVPVGIEHPSFLKDMQKGVNAEQIRKSFEALNEMGIKTIALMMLGWKDETKETLQEALDFLKTISYDRVRISFVTPLEGTRLWKEYGQEGLFEKDSYDLMRTDLPIIETRKLRDQLIAEGVEMSPAEYMTNFRQKMFDELYTDPKYLERQRRHLENTTEQWDEQWAPLWVEAHLDHFEYIHNQETSKFDGETMVSSRVENPEVCRMIDEIQQQREHQKELERGRVVSEAELPKEENEIGINTEPAPRIDLK